MYDPVRDALMSNTTATTAAAAEEEKQRGGFRGSMVLSETRGRVVVEGDVVETSSSGKGPSTFNGRDK